ncbi:hypothetical protein [Flavobacterium sp. FlaQc-50]|uniref:hypothetical protein n=1 Tax=unclassified Flavobacterium TaxID=196869 RepID=UPI0037579A2E
MATPGTFTAYRALKPLDGDVSQDIQQQEENGVRRRAEKRVDDNIKQNRIDKADKEKQDLWNKYVKPLSNYDTGSTSLNEAQGRLILEAQKEYVPLMGVINNPKSTDEEKLKATLKLQNINSLPENLASMTKSLTDRDLAIKKGVADGTLFPDKAYDTNFQTGYQNKLLALDEHGMPLIAFKNPDGTTDFETYDKIQNVVPKYDIQKRFDRDKELLEASTKLQPEINQTDDGTQQVKTTAINPALLKEYVNNQLYEADGVTPTTKLKSFAREAGITDFSDAKALKTVSDAFENDIKLRVKGGKEVTKNFNNLDVQKEKRQAAKDARSEQKENEKTEVERSPITFDSSMRKDDFTNKVLEKGAVRPNMIGIKGDNLKFKNIGGKNSGLNDGFVTGFALDNKGDIVVTGKAIVSKGNKYKKGSDGLSFDEGSTDPTLDSYSTGNTYGNFRRIVKGAELNDLVTRAKYSNVEELKAELKELNKSSKSKTSTSNKIKIDY